MLSLPPSSLTVGARLASARALPGAGPGDPARCTSWYGHQMRRVEVDGQRLVFCRVCGHLPAAAQPVTRLGGCTAWNGHQLDVQRRGGAAVLACAVCGKTCPTGG